MRSKMPKVYYVFYEHFFKAVVGDRIWKRRFNESRFSTNVLEAFTHLCVQNNYFAWLYDYMVSHLNSTLKTEYDLANEEPSDTEGLSGDLGEVEIALPATTAGDFTLLFNKMKAQHTRQPRKHQRK